MPTFRDHQITRRVAGSDYQEGDDLETFLSHHHDAEEPSISDDEYEADDDDDNSGEEEEDDDDDDPTLRYKRIYYSLRRTSPQLLLFAMGYVLLGSFVMTIWYMTGHSFLEPLDVDQGATYYQHRLKLADIHHWCRASTTPTTLSATTLTTSSSSMMAADRAQCKSCLNPLLPQDRHDREHWSSTHDDHVQSAQQAAKQQPRVIFLGDSITEGWTGKSFGQDRPYKQDNVAVFDDLFGPESSIPALPLGIAGDKCPHLLWRMQHGEVPAQLNPPIWWILIGTNDFNRDASCSPEVVVMGMQRVLEEMISRKPQAHIVVNSLLPRATDHPQGWLMDQGVVSSSPQQHHDPLTLDESGNTPTTSSSHPNTATPTTSLWQDIQTVNQAMERYIQAIQQEQRAKVWFFNATSLLLRPHNHTVPHSTYYIPVEYMSDYLHPTAAGYRIWGNAMITFMKKNMNLT